jgi:hypothetical protein
LTTGDIDKEVKAALSFKPRLKMLYILTTAPNDATLLAHVRKLNLLQRRKKLFEVVLLGWGEIVRLATRDPQVADKHFGPLGGAAPRSPLLATFMMSKSTLEKAGLELELSIKELAQDLRDWPTGHVAVRQHESDVLIERLRPFDGRKLSTKERYERIKLRDELRVLTDAEREAERAILLLLTDPDVSAYMLKVWEGDAPLAIEAFVNNHLRPLKSYTWSNGSELRMSPPGDPERRCTAYLTKADVSSILTLRQQRQSRYGKPLTDSVDELPPQVRAKVAVPRIIRGLFDFVSEDRLSWEQIRAMQALNLGQWSVSIA